jgi:hypothetical protein
MVVLSERPEAWRLHFPASHNSLLPSPSESKEHLIGLGVERQKLPIVPEQADLVGLLCSLDRLSATAGCGQAGLRWFLRRPHAALDGRAPCDLIAEAQGVDRVRRLVGEEVLLVVPGGSVSTDLDAERHQLPG